MRTAKTKAGTPVPVPYSPSPAFRGSDACQGKPISNVEQVLSDTASAFCPWHLAFPPGCCCRHMPMEPEQWQMHLRLCVRRNCPRLVGFWWLGLERVHKDLHMLMLWFLCDHLFIFPNAVCSYSPSVFSHQTALFFLLDVSQKCHKIVLGSDLQSCHTILCELVLSSHQLHSLSLLCR